MKIYLAGPMRNIPEFNFPAFHMYASKLRAEGHLVFSPAENDIAKTDIKITGTTGSLQEIEGKNGWTLRNALCDDLAFITQEAEAIALLPGWEKSKGVAAELATAKALGLRVIILEEGTRI